MLKIIWQHTNKFQRVCLFVAPLIMLMEVFCDLQQPTLMAHIVDKGLVSGGRLGIIIQTGVTMVLFAIGGLLSGAGCNAFGSLASLGMGQQLRNHLMTLALTARNGHEMSTPTLITRITNDVIQMQNLVMTLTRSMIRAPFLLLGGVVMSFIISPRLAWILVVVVPILLIFMILVIRRSVPLFTTVQQAIDKINRVMRETLLGIKTVKSYVLEDQQYNAFNQTNDRVKESSIVAQQSIIILSPVVILALNISVVAALWFGGRLHAENAITNGQIIAFVNYMIQITNAMINTVNTVSSLSRAQTATIRINEILQLKREPVQTPTIATPKLSSVQFNQVSFAYQDGENVLNDVSFELDSGQKMGIIGTTGSGKTTLVNLITRLYDPTSGSIKLGGIDIRDLTIAQIRRKVAVALQTSTLFSGTITSNLRYGKVDATEAQLQEAARAADADAFIQQRDAGYLATVDQRGNNFSGGQKQRLNIARALIAQPDILILDDVTSAVDLATDARIQRAIRQTRRDRTTIMISQRVSAIMDSDLILVLDHGAVMGMGTHQQLMQRSAFYRSIAIDQLGGMKNE